MEKKVVRYKEQLNLGTILLKKINSLFFSNYRYFLSIGKDFFLESKLFLDLNFSNSLKANKKDLSGDFIYKLQKINLPKRVIFRNGNFFYDGHSWYYHTKIIGLF